MFDQLALFSVICVCAGIRPVRKIPLRARVWIGLGLAAAAYCAAMAGQFLVSAGFDTQLLRNLWACSFAMLAVPAIGFLVPTCQDWLRARWRHAVVR